MYKDKECPSGSYAFKTRKLIFKTGYYVLVNNELIGEGVFNAKNL